MSAMSRTARCLEALIWLCALIWAAEWTLRYGLGDQALSATAYRSVDVVAVVVLPLLALAFFAVQFASEPLPVAQRAGLSLVALLVLLLPLDLLLGDAEGAAAVFVTLGAVPITIAMARLAALTLRRGAWPERAAVGLGLAAVIALMLAPGLADALSESALGRLFRATNVFALPFFVVKYAAPREFLLALLAASAACWVVAPWFSFGARPEANWLMHLRRVFFWAFILAYAGTIQIFRPEMMVEGLFLAAPRADDLEADVRLIAAALTTYIFAYLFLLRPIMSVLSLRYRQPQSLDPDAFA